jgi:pyruvate-formate lyase-activating enzyme
MVDKYFPINTETSCKLKWSCTTLYLNSGRSATCHRTSHHDLTPENFNNFHNNPVVIEDRNVMLRGEWPEKNCSYCREIEQTGGISDRIRQSTIPGLYPPELDTDPTLVNVEPIFLEVFFNNTCNLGCLYCSSTLSSVIEHENKKFGYFKKDNLEIKPESWNYKELSPYFWKWFRHGFPKLKRLQILGGEPFYQTEMNQLLGYIEQNPNPECEIAIVTNLMVSHKKMIEYVARFKKIVANRKIRRLDIVCSIDCWGPQQEYVRWGLNLEEWQENFELLLKNKWIYLSVNQTISALTIKTMPEFLSKLAIWKKERKIGHHFSGITPGPSYLKAEIFGQNEFLDHTMEILNLMPQITDEDKTAYGYMSGILTHINRDVSPNYTEIKKLLIFLDEKDRRRGTNWELLFPWLVKYRELGNVV